MAKLVGLGIGGRAEEVGDVAIELVGGPAFLGEISSEAVPVEASPALLALAAPPLPVIDKKPARRLPRIWVPEDTLGRQATDTAVIACVPSPSVLTSASQAAAKDRQRERRAPAFRELIREEAVA